MSTKKPPVQIGVQGTDPNLAKYKGDIERRNAERKAAKPPGPDFGAALAYDPKRDGPTTIQHLGDVHRQIEESSVSQEEAKPRLSEGTIAGLAALQSQVEKVRAAAPAPAPTPAAEEKPAAKEEPKTDTKDRKDFAEVDDMALDRILSMTALRDREDAINNDKEREAAEKRVEPIDVMQGILDGEYKQVVPVVPGKLDVVYRTVSPAEDQAIRLYIFKLTSTDGRLESVATDLYSLLTLTAGIVMISGKQLPAHFTREGFTIKVNEETLGLKLNLILSYPMPLIHALSVHQFWFDQRVRKAFTTVDLGNG
jgi:hypothetical protein